MALASNPDVVVIQIDATGTAENRPCPFKYATDAQIIAGDPLAASPVPVPSQKVPPGQPQLTFAVATLSGTTWNTNVTVVSGNPNFVYKCALRAQTTAGYTVMSYVDVVLEGIGQAPVPSPAPTIGGITGTFGG